MMNKKEIIYYCPECGTELEPETACMQSEYGEADMHKLPLEYRMLWCPECEETYNGEEI